MNQQPRPEQNGRQAESAAQRKRRLIEEYKQAAEEQRKRWMPLVRYMRKNNMKIKTARCHNKRIEYFRTDQLEELLNKNKETLSKDAVLAPLVASWNRDVIYFQRPETAEKRKYPKELEQTQNNAASKFASFKFDTAERNTWLFPLIVGAVVACVLFPLWPYTLKYIVFMILLSFVIAIISIIILRLVVYLIFAVFGASFWIFPNFFGDDLSIINTFLPLYEYKKWQGHGVFNIIGRLLSFMILGYYAYHAYMDSSWIYENIEITKSSMGDLHDWGVGYIKGEKNFSQSALTNLDHIMNQTAEVEVDQTIDLENQENMENTETQENADDQNDGSAQSTTDNQNSPTNEESTNDSL